MPPAAQSGWARQEWYYFASVASQLQFVACVALVACLRLPAAATTPKQLEQDLKARWMGQEFVLRGFPGSNHFSTDAEGRWQKPLPQAAWTLSEIRVSRIKVNSREIEVDGKRLVMIYDKTAKVMTTANWNGGPKVRIDVLADPAAMDDAAEVRLQNGLFLRDLNGVAAAAPEYWRNYLTGKPSLPNNLRERGITLPQLISAPDPAYSTAARLLRLQGTTTLAVTVTVRGSVTDISIVQPIGGGLDEQAVAAVSRWQFRPALDGSGQPVDARVEIEANFKLLR